MNAPDLERLSELNVSRETFERLKIYVQLLERWNPKINLVSSKTLSEVWDRHILDSLQVFRYGDQKGHWVDIGSGGGFPGMVCAIFGHEHRPDQHFTCVESDQRKAVFLRTVARECGVPCKVVSKRIEQIDSLQADILSARALADLTTLLEFSDRHLKREGAALFLKGQNWRKEVSQAKMRWKFSHEAITSLTEPSAVLLKIDGVSRV